MTTTQTRRPATTDDLTIGAIVYKGKGKVPYRVFEVAVHEGRVWAVYAVKTTTKVNPSRSIPLYPRNLTVED